MSDTTTLWEFPEEGMSDNALNWLRMFGGRGRTFIQACIFDDPPIVGRARVSEEIQQALMRDGEMDVLVEVTE